MPSESRNTNSVYRATGGLVGYSLWAGGIVLATPIEFMNSYIGLAVMAAASVLAVVGYYEMSHPKGFRGVMVLYLGLSTANVSAIVLSYAVRDMMGLYHWKLFAFLSVSLGLVASVGPLVGALASNRLLESRNRGASA